MRLALAQLNPLVGDLRGNAALLLEACRQAQAAGADLVVAPELALWGYPARDLLLRSALREREQQMLDQLAGQLPAGLALVLGVSEPAPGQLQPDLFNAAALVEAGQWRVVARKRLLPSYDVFDERRYFRSAEQPCLLELERGGRRWRLGLTICEDLWACNDPMLAARYGRDPLDDAQPADLLINLSASPFARGKIERRLNTLASASAKLQTPILYLNQVGANDELIFDGTSPFRDAAAAPLVPAAAPTPPLPLPLPLPLPDANELLLRALVLGVRDYARKCGFSQALLGLSGGIDSALVAVIASAALGPRHVQGLLMPSPWSSRGSIHDALALAARLGVSTHTVPIAPLMAAFDAALTPALQGPPAGVTAENLQSRIRGTLLMGVANQQGQLLLSTGNKSELAVGYCTLYGDM
ncbi:MAG: NAD(+) synthase, partial [Synechococcaceae bacterium WB8_1B_136]|nr:NAD(+) synthase [Synechococcaceae bacterium WB8_1B_136]